ncbi:hypothetical protein FAM8374_00572 [Lacticaseibacillus paracasei]|nr:hypothetical protein FAM8374_00572 [Lacticaseibacillus paracasei]
MSLFYLTSLLHLNCKSVILIQGMCYYVVVSSSRSPPSQLLLFTHTFRFFILLALGLVSEGFFVALCISLYDN